MAAFIAPAIGAASGIIGGLLQPKDPYVNENQSAQYNYMGNLIGEQQAAWGTNQAASQEISNMWAPVAQSGQLPYGYAPSLDAALRTGIVNQGNQATTNAINADQLRQQQASGGAPVLPTGAAAQTEAATRATGQQQTAANLNQERIAGYNQGVQNLTAATGGIAQAANLENPTGLANAAVGEGGNVTNAVSLANKNQQNSLLSSVLGGISGGAGNLDTQNTSNTGEQFQNFLTGMGGGNS